MDSIGSEEINTMPEYCIDVGCSATYYSDPWYDLLSIIVFTLVGLGVVAIQLIRSDKK